jgi:hypothetical protein
VPTMDEFSMIEAPSGINGSAFCTVKSVPFTLVSKRALHIGVKDEVVELLGDRSERGIPRHPGALANTMSSLPLSRLTCAKRRSRSSKFDTSPCTPATFLPMSFTAASNPDCLRPVIKTNAPSSTSCFAVARPIPLLPPVMSATFLRAYPWFHLLGADDC